MHDWRRWFWPDHWIDLRGEVRGVLPSQAWKRENRLLAC
jgi:hypothetical protein